MPRNLQKGINKTIEKLPSLPLDDSHWQAVFKAMGLSSPRQIDVVRLTLRDASNRQIAAALGISLPTVKTHQERIAARLGVRSRMQLAMHVLAVSHQVKCKNGSGHDVPSAKRR